jgi:cytochrome c2
MTESVAVAKEADAKKGVSSTNRDNSIHRVRNEPERQLGSLRGVIGKTVASHRLRALQLN